MTVESVFRELICNRGYFPGLAVAQAQQMQAELMPIMLQALTRVADDPDSIAEGDDYLLHIYAMFLLAHWREPAAFPLLVQLFAGDSDLVEETTGDMLTEDLQSLLASVFPGDLAELDQLVCDTTLNPYLRGAAIQCLLVLYVEGAVEREVIAARYQQWLDFYLQAGLADDFALSSLVAGSCDLQLHQLLPRVERAYQKGLVDSLSMSLDEVRSDLAPGPLTPKSWLDSKQYRYIDDVAGAMSWWACFEMESTDDLYEDAFEPPFYGAGSG
jgi:hypothetical protein